MYISWLQDSKGSIMGVVLFNKVKASVVPFGGLLTERVETVLEM